MKIKKVHYMLASDPCARLLFQNAANLWSGEDMPDWRENEYARGQVETLADSIRLWSEGDKGELDWEDVKDRAASLINVASDAPLYDELLAEYGLVSA